LKTLFPNGQRTSFSYSSVSAGSRLQTLWHKLATGATLAKFDYTYDAEGQIQTLSEKFGSLAPFHWSYEYDATDQLLAATEKNDGGQLLQQQAWGYDDAGNRLTEQITRPGEPTMIVSGTHNSVNQLTEGRSGGLMAFAGHVNQRVTNVTVGGASARISGETNFAGVVGVAAGTNVVTVVATVPGGARATNRYEVLVAGGSGTNLLAYDANGNLVSKANGSGVTTYEWDGADRLVTITQTAPGGTSSTSSHFEYDGYGRRVKLVEKTNGVVQSTKQFVWCGAAICEERNATNGVTKRFFGQGQQNGGTDYFYTRDHLGSVREMVGANGTTVVARYDYDPYGKRGTNQITSGAVEADFGFTGHYYHAPSGLHLAWFRAYDAETGRWLGRDPIGEDGGVNLYGYVGNGPVSAIDPLGLFDGNASNKNFFGKDWKEYRCPNVPHVEPPPVLINNAFGALGHYLAKSGSPAVVGPGLQQNLNTLQKCRKWENTDSPAKLRINDYGSWKHPVASLNVWVSLGQFRYTQDPVATTVNDYYGFPFAGHNWLLAWFLNWAGEGYPVSGSWPTPP
jgi:RHS repeat-associated protein